MSTITRYTKGFARYLRNTRAVSALEYAILVGVIAVAIVAALQTFSGQIKTAMDAIGTEVEDLQGQVRQRLKAPPPLPKQSLSFFGTGRWGGSGGVASSCRVCSIAGC